MDSQSGCSLVACHDLYFGMTLDIQNMLLRRRQRNQARTEPGVVEALRTLKELQSTDSFDLEQLRHAAYCMISC